MRHLFFLIAVLCVVFLRSTAPSLGLEKVTTVVFLPMFFYFAFNSGFINRLFTQKLRYDKVPKYILILAVIIIIFKWTIEQDYLKMALEFLIIPMLISICFESLDRKELTILFRVVIIFYITECGLSIVEWILNRNFFVDSEYTDKWLKWGFFRSTALLGHPLANAQVVAFFMTFIAIYDFKKMKYIQIILFFLGYVSLFCFNARGATLVVTILIVPYFIWKLIKSTKKFMKLIIILGVLCMSLGLLYMVTQTSLGGRLMNKELMDSSAQTRLEVFKFYNYYKNNNDFLWGNPDNYEYMMGRLEAGGVENGVIAMLLDYGIIFTIPLLILLFRFQYLKLSVYSRSDKWLLLARADKWLLLAVFFIIGCMNPILARPIQWVLWVFAYYAFRPELLGVTVTPDIVNVKVGGNKMFSATVDGTYHPIQTVTWIVEGAAGSTIINEKSELTVATAETAKTNSTAELNVATNETAKTLTVRATSTADNTLSGTATVAVTHPPSNITTKLPKGTVGTPYNETLTAYSSVPDITWALGGDNDHLPDGLRLSAEGTIFGMPTTAGTFTFTVKATNVAGSNTQKLSIEIVTDILLNGTVETPYEEIPHADGAWTLVIK